MAANTGLLLIVLGIAGIGAWMIFDLWRDARRNRKLRDRASQGPGLGSAGKTTDYEVGPKTYTRLPRHSKEER